MSVASRIRKVLIANRGEIACRVIRSAKRLGVKTVGVYSDADSLSMHVQLADEAYNIGKPPAQDSYLKGEKLIEVAKKVGASAIHPGYGFLSENAEFAALCQNSGVTFIGPPPSAIRDMGIKSTSKEIMSAAGVPVIPGYHGSEQSVEKLLEEAKIIGFPLMIKAVRGGGGKGMRIVKSEDEFMAMLDSAKRESLRSFGNDDVLLERYVGRPRHIEVQVFGDTHGNYVYLYERDCSVQRRHQKVIEQAPAPGIDGELRKKLGEAGVRAAQAVGYVGAGTVEFILDTDTNQFYFMEMNTRLQVEHPVTEMITGVDLVEWQLRVAAGEKLPLKQEQIPLKGCSLEARIYAEDVPAGFLPTAGHIRALSLPMEDDLRVETGVRSGDIVSVHYDPMIAKLVVWHPEVGGAFSKLERALGDFNIVGVENNVDFLRRLSRHKDLIDGNSHTGFIDEHRDNLLPKGVSSDLILQATLGVLLQEEFSLKENAVFNNDICSPFATSSSFRMNLTHNKKVKLKHQEKTYEVNVTYEDHGWLELKINNTSFRCKASLLRDSEFKTLVIQTPDLVTKTKFYYFDDKIYIFNENGDVRFDVLSDYVKAESSSNTGNQAVSPMPGVVEKVFVKNGDVVKVGDPIAVVMAMKMEHVIKADKDGIVSSVLYRPGDSVGKNVALVTFSENE